MDEADDLDHDNYSLAGLARAFGMDRATVAQRLKDGKVQAAGKRGGYPTYALRDAVPALFFSRVEGGDSASMRPTDVLALERAAESRVDRALKERKLQELEGELVRVSEATLQMAAIVKPVAQLFDTLPDILERDCNLPVHAVLRCRDVLEKERNHLAELLTAE